MLSPSHRSRRDIAREAARDGGYVMALSALLLLPLLAFTGLAVDLGSWYARAAAVQRTTDAAALAGVAFLPIDQAQAIAVARSTAAQNGFDPATNPDISVTVTPLAGDQLQVRITDNSVPQYFTSLFRDTVTVSRGSIAEYVPPIRMGSPRNFLGTGNLSRSTSGLPSGAILEQFMLSVNGPCDRAEDGDLRQSLRMGNNSSSNKCTGGDANPEYDANGYAYGIRTNAGYSGGPLVIEVFDAPYCTGSGHDLNLGGATFHTRYTVRAPDADPFAGAPVATHTLTPSDCGGWGNQWRAIATINPTPGQAHVVQVQSLNHSDSGRTGGANQFAIRARRSAGGFVACSADPNETDNALRQASTGVSPANCPNVFAYQDLSVFAASAGSTAEFFLASIGPEHSGKRLIIELYDPGEGGQSLRVTDPNGQVVGPGNGAGVTSFERSVVSRFAGEAAPGGGWGPFTESVVDIRPAGPAPGPGRATDARCTGQNSANPACRYNERRLRLEIELPDNIDAAYGGRTWWRIRYQFATGISVTDRTTWSVSVEGGPVRLIE
ncbi:pilus assembly protein TadG-related protein [Actinomarinicola tropica]|uniref:Putative Flp pilus-assembly TadG-like N-terminal domain-containing protein n=1 Tax=Actinomarinicola tropica TaxID=2789776 RepID=A0A5Q2RMQ8_9ACTN|nr:Tad domain-containing protein [Actinomarinicola tropica]QGG95696.1 hypothetical protein GH723_11640 [Actinomarinicola tropica]